MDVLKPPRSEPPPPPENNVGTLSAFTDGRLNLISMVHPVYFCH